VYEVIGPLVDPPVRKRLEKATQPIGPASWKQKKRRICKEAQTVTQRKALTLSALPPKAGICDATAHVH
jgi:hypothetical protein